MFFLRNMCCGAGSSANMTAMGHEQRSSLRMRAKLRIVELKDAEKEESRRRCNISPV